MDRRTELRQLWQEFPSSNFCMQNLLMAMDNAEKSFGKRTLFGKDKGLPAVEKFMESFKTTLNAMFEEEVLSKGQPPENVAAEFLERLENFAEAYPNWPDAYRFAASFFNAANKANVMALIGEVVSFQEFLDAPRINRGPKLVKPEEDKWGETDPRIKKVFDARKK